MGCFEPDGISQHLSSSEGACGDLCPYWTYFERPNDTGRCPGCTCGQHKCSKELDLKDFSASAHTSLWADFFVRLAPAYHHGSLVTLAVFHGNLCVSTRSNALEALPPLHQHQRI